MQARPCVLIAAQPGAWAILRAMLEDVFDLVPAHSTSDALQILDSQSASIAAIVSTIAFDDSRMMEFLHAAKSRPNVSAIPFICSRVLPTVLSDDAVARVAEVCRLAGAVDFIDIPGLDERSAPIVLKAVLQRHIESAPGATPAA